MKLEHDISVVHTTHPFVIARGGATEHRLIRVRISDGDISHQTDITLDPVSSMPVKLGFTTLSDPAHPVHGEEVTADWETVQGLRFPRRWTVLRSGVRVAEARDAHSIVNGGLKLEDLAAKPPDMKPVLSSR